MKAKTNIELKHLDTFNKIKCKYRDALVLLRIEDDYATFGQDALKVHEITRIETIPNPVLGNTSQFHFLKLDLIMRKLVKAGYRVAICDPLG